MKLPSLQQLSTDLQASFKRFPLTIIYAFFASCTAITAIQIGDDIENHFYLLNILLSLAIGIPLSFCASIYSEEAKPKHLSFLAQLIVFALVVSIYFYLPASENEGQYSVPYIKYVLYAAIAHLLVAFIPFIKKGFVTAFWNYNKDLFSRFITTILYSGTLFIGLVIALGACQLLLGLDIKPQRYFQLFALVGGLFNTWFFVSKIPSNILALETVSSFPKGLKIFTQFILIPLLVLYFIIVYVYGAQITLSWSWPKGIVSWLISIISVLGIFSFLLLYPFKHLATSHWISKFNKVFYYLMLPLIALLFISISFRASDYGITINRYLVYSWGIWLSIVCIYAIIKPNNIKFIPQSLALTLLLISFGPWGVFSVSEHSQSKRLIDILETSGIVENGKVVNEFNYPIKFENKYDWKEYEPQNQHLISDSTHNEIISILKYLNKYHGYGGIESIFSQDITKLLTDDQKVNYRGGEYMTVQRLLNLKPKSYSRYYGSVPTYFYFYSNENLSVNTQDYTTVNYLDRLSNWSEEVIETKHVKYAFSYSFKNNLEITFEHNNRKEVLDLKPFVTNLLKNYKKNEDITGETLTINKRFKDFEIKMVLHSFSLNRTDDDLTLSNLTGMLLVKENLN